MLNLAANKKIFGFHPKYNKLGLTYLSFADDLLIFCKGNVNSVVGVLSVLDQFQPFSGLKFNSSKSELFVAGIPISIIDIIKRVSGFKIGPLLVKYLGIPLVSHKLNDKDCEALITNIKQRLQIWSGRNLSYAGRLELIKTVLYSVCNYWCRQLMLPTSILNKVEQLSSRFFWKGTNTKAVGTRVSWARICLPKSDEGLGLKNLKNWCRLNSYVFKNQNFWHFQAGATVSWSIKQILKLRTDAFSLLTTGHLQTKDFWEITRTQEQKVLWHQLIWFPMHVPKHSLIAWMALLDRLPTRDHLKRMGICSEGIYVNCNSFQETRDHLFFICPLEANLWRAILLHNGMNTSFTS
ncbi:uncharacterized protein LOC120216981 [Hibiscus syriacus]|uniref:uncharacterized protein LOC120216981 n=1 Tax=Hibiscus syriacus TaxID=106335 RepID=UPI0019238160|nr:uncharacterized protein LOC120216981 [Hibiscus syriacus]